MSIPSMQMLIAATSVLPCVAGVEMGRGLGGREKRGGLAREDKVSSSSLFRPLTLFSLSSSPYPPLFPPVTQATCVYNRRFFV